MWPFFPPNHFRAGVGLLGKRPIRAGDFGRISRGGIHTFDQSFLQTFGFDRLLPDGLPDLRLYGPGNASLKGECYWLGIRPTPVDEEISSMRSVQSPCGARRRDGFLRPILGVLVALILGVTMTLAQLGPVLAAQAPLVVTNDLGGALQDRVAQVEQLRRNGTRVEIRGTCVSACTLYLGLSRTCVDRNARLGFHGPSTPFPGIPLPPDQFERLTQQMAAYYPGGIRGWFMTTARKVTDQYYVLTGAEAISMGARPCDGAVDVAFVSN